MIVSVIRLLTFTASMLLMLVSFASATMWVRSYVVSDALLSVEHVKSHRKCLRGITSSNGSFSIVKLVGDNISWQRLPDEDVEKRVWRWSHDQPSRWSLHDLEVHLDWPMQPLPSAPGVVYERVCAPYWSIVGGSALLPSLVFVRWWRKRRGTRRRGFTIGTPSRLQPLERC